MDIPVNKQLIDKTFADLSANVDRLYDFVMLYHDYIYSAKDYGNGDLIRMVEMHTLTMIHDCPGITVSMLAKHWKRTKGTVSVNVSMLEKKGYIERKKMNGNTKTEHLFVTKAGEELSYMHKIYDICDILQTQDGLMKTCTHEDISGFYRVISSYLDLLVAPDSECALPE